MCIDPPNYEAIEAQMWLENGAQAEIVRRLDEGDKNLSNRIETYTDRFNYSLEEVEERIRKDLMFAATFAKNAKRQGFHKKAATHWLSEKLNKLGIEFEILPKKKSEAVYITGDGVIMSSINEPDKPSRSLDFRWQYNGFTFYAVHKHTTENGGDQDTQYRVMRDLLENFRNAKNPKKSLIVIVDGPYYTEKKMKELYDQTNSQAPRSYAVHIEGVPKIMAEYDE